MDNYTRNHTRKLFVHARTYQTLDKKKLLVHAFASERKRLKYHFHRTPSHEGRNPCFPCSRKKKKTNEKVFKSVAFAVENAMFARLLLVEN